MIVVGAVEIVVEAGGFFFVSLFHAFGAAAGLDPVEHESHDVNRVARGRVEHRSVLGVGVVAQHGRDGGGEIFADEVVANDDEGDAGRCQVLLRTGIKDAEFGHVNRLGQNVRRTVTDEGNVPRVGEIAPFGAVDRVVERDVDIVVIPFDFADFGDVATPAVARRRHDVDRGEETPRLLDGLFGPHARIDVCRPARLVEVERNHCKLQTRPSLQKQHAIVVGDVHEVADFGLTSFDDRLVGGRAVAHFHDGLAGPVAVEHFFGADFQNGFGKR